MKNEFLETMDKKKCNGCGVCVLRCPVKAMYMETDAEGFQYPKIDESKCIKCNKCKNFCSNSNLNNTILGEIYAGYTISDEELRNASSGGIFFVLAKYVIESNGVVFGVQYNKNLEAEHSFSEDLDGCKKFRGSKYVRSNINDSYEKVKQFLDENRMVLFTGTPCQCKGLKDYLNKNYPNLITCDIICHANPSPKVLKKYIEELEKIKKAKVTNIYFRSKENGWRKQIPIIEYDNGEKEGENTYYTAFVRELIGRPSCNNCQFASRYRISEFTIGDLWGKEKMNINIDNGDKGISLFTINNEKGKKFFEKIKKNLVVQRIENEETAYRCNHYTNVNENKNRRLFFEKIDNKKSIIKWMKQNSKEPMKKRVKEKLKKVLKKV